MTVLVDGKPLTGRMLAVVTELVRRSDRFESLRAGEVTVYISEGSLSLGIEERYSRVRLDIGADLVAAREQS